MILHTLSEVFEYQATMVLKSITSELFKTIYIYFYLRIFHAIIDAPKVPIKRREELKCILC